MDLRIRNRRALVTGAGRGIGAAIASELAREGARVVLVARSQDQLAAVKCKLDGPAENHQFIAVDLMADNGVQQLAKLMQDPDDLDIIVHNLGGSNGVFQTFASSKDWQLVWQFNVGIAHDINRIFIPAMVRKKWGRIVYLSTLSTVTYNGYAAYVSAKCALNGYVKSINREVSKDNVIISAVAPGAIYSEGRFFARLQKDNPAGLEEYFNNHLPIRRLGRAEDVAPAVAFLCSEQASFMAGSIVGIDGGGM